ncbi:autotransporter outer membrane beta-barrel domain-containing protein [Bradyrhizobium sp. JYMT SZCCT0180]|uniref:autotransporter outer membrane beta-barrel domain-containing protein n=1 Tax=Bradyrhizobium sp. JYMT SZCCT0180 TaxID=2807666 RepID=UPI001BA9BE67|nr:autotransporter outer membrane beta-barrel domain-containing protein [Bradyrhizobium sp. JYMT SZCCT0180]MBR1213918.1 autotransporter outer membrane beta-barrel domain-containing protein [Bradyrhizobium sp. JYMT SZCCT0180]
MSVSVAALAALSPRSAAAQGWTGATSNDWTVGLNWNTGTVPAGGAVVIEQNSNIVLGVAAGATGTTGNFRLAGTTAGVTANLTIQNGAILTTTGASLTMGSTTGTTSSVTVTGAGSRWNINGILNVNAFGTNTLNIENGAVVAGGRINVTSPGGTGSGTLNIRGGTLQVTNIGFGPRGQANYDNAVVRAVGNNANFFGGTAAQNNIAAGGLTFDTNGFTVIASSAGGLSGVGGLTKTGAGTLFLRGGSTYTGETVIQQGTLSIGVIAGASDALINSSRVVANATFDISAVFDPASHIQSLAGTGTVVLGAKDLIVTNGHDTFAGSIGGTGGLQVTGGTQALSSAQAYSGVTTISGGTLALTDAGSVAASSQVIANGTFSIAGLAGAGTSIQRLSGTGSVDLGARTLTLTAANDAFAGVIGGSGGLTLAGGTQTLSGVNIFGGVTTISAGTLALAGTGAIGNSSHVVVGSTFDISALAGAGTNIQSLAGNGSVALGAKTLTITNASDTFAGVISGTGGLTISGGMQTLSGVNTYLGATTVSGGTLAVNGSLCGATSVLAGGTLQGTGSVCDTVNAGIVAPGNSIGTLTVVGNYTGNGGTLQIETVLGGDASPTDRLVVTGNTAGNTNVRVINLGGTGAQTVEGIKIVDVAGASNGVFSLLGNYVIQGQQAVVGGAYAYTLRKNGVSNPADGDWYLRSALIDQPSPGVAPPPLYQPGVPLYENYAQVLLGLNDVPTLQQRVGNRYWGGSDAMARAGVAPVPGATSPAPTAFWGRIEGGRADLQPASTTGSTTKADQMKVQAGLDGLALENERGRLIVGLTAQYGLATANVASMFGNGRIRTEGSGVGGTLTWYGDNGFYVDGQAQSMFYRSDLSSVLVGSMTHGNEGVGYAFSAETGKRFGVGNGWSLTPQAQLSYSKVAFESFADRFGAQVSLRDGDSLLGRAGLALNHQKTWNDGAGIVRSDVYGIANLRYEFLSGTNVDVAGTGFANAQDRLWGSLGGGGIYSWANGRYAVFGEVSYNASLEHAAVNHSYKGSGGFRIVW